MVALQGRVLVLAVAFTFLLVSCSGNPPDAETWQPEWQALVEVVPEQTELHDPPDQSLCEGVLAAIREGNEDLLPSPSAEIDELANEWISVAEEAFFDCPPTRQDANGFDQAYMKLRELETSVDTALANQ